MKKLLYILFVLLSVILASCSSSTTTDNTPSSDPKLASLTFRANDSIPGLAAASFTIEEPADTGKIYNIDSLAYGTRIDSVVPIFRFNATPAVARLITSHDTIDLTGLDTIDFSERPVRLFVLAADLVHTRWYNIYVNVHNVDPDLYTWERLSGQITPNAYSSQKAFRCNNQIVFLTSDGLDISAFVSSDGVTWQSRPTNLPRYVSVKKSLLFGNGVLLADKNMLYHSADGLQWTEQDCSALDFEFENLLFCLADSAWAIVREKSNDDYHFATSADGKQWHCHTEILPAHFPVSEFGTTVFVSPGLRERAIILGGYDAAGNMLNTSWNIERYDAGGFRWTEYSDSQPGVLPVAGAQVVYYNGRLFVFGGIGADGRLKQYKIKESLDEGLTWHDTDSVKNVLPPSYTYRYGQSVFIVDGDIYLIGGQSLTEVYSDVYKGRLGSIDFLKK